MGTPRIENHWPPRMSSDDEYVEWGADGSVAATNHTTGYSTPDASEPSECSVCNTGFSMTEQRHHCKFCEDVVCFSCVADKALHPDSGNEESICRLCAEELAMAVAELKAEQESGIQDQPTANTESDVTQTLQPPAVLQYREPIVWGDNGDVQDSAAADINQLEHDFDQYTAAGAGHTTLAQSAVPAEPTDLVQMEVVAQRMAASGKWAEIGWRKSPNYADKLAGKHGAKRGIVYEGKLVENDGLHWLQVSMPDGVSPVAVPVDDIDNSSYICTRRATVCDTRHCKFLYVPLTDLEGSEMMRTTSRLQTYQLLKPTPWCRSTDVEDTMQSNAEAGESWQGKVVMVADVAFLAVEMATEPPSRRQYLPLGLKEAKPNVRQVQPAGVVVSSRCDSIIHSETAARVIQYQQTVRLTQRERNASDSPSAPG